jgi:urease accessory protein
MVGVEIDEGKECPQVVLWQLADSAFPAGSLAHSNGLEASVQAGRVYGPDGLFKFAQESLHALTYNSLPLISAARSCCKLNEFIDVDASCDSALVMNHVARRASVAQGKGIMNATAAAFPFLGIKELRKQLDSKDGFACHFAPIFGLICRLLGVKEIDAKRMFLFMTLRYASATRGESRPSPDASCT